MATGKSKLYSAFAILFSLIVLAGGAAKLFRGVNALAKNDSNPKIREILTESDAAIDKADQDAVSANSAFRDLLSDFDTMGPQVFRAEKGQACEKLCARYTAICDHLTRASNKAMEAVKIGVSDKLQGFLSEKSKSYDLLVKANTRNIDIIHALLDESMVDANTIVAKIKTIAESRDADKKASREADTKADAFIFPSKT